MSLNFFHYKKTMHSSVQETSSLHHKQHHDYERQGFTVNHAVSSILISLDVMPKNVCITSELLEAIAASKQNGSQCPIYQLKHAQTINELPTARQLKEIIRPNQTELINYTVSQVSCNNVTGPAQMVIWVFKCEELTTTKCINRLPTHEKNKLRGLSDFLIEVIQTHPQAKTALKELKPSQLQRLLHCSTPNLHNANELREQLAIQVLINPDYLLTDLPTDMQKLKIAALAVIVNPESLQLVNTLDIEHKEHIELIRHVRKGNITLNTIPQFADTRDVVLAAVTFNGWALGRASERLKNDRDIVIAAVNSSGNALFLAPNTFRNDRDVVLQAVRNYGNALLSASEELKNDREIVTVAVNNSSEALLHASDELQNDFDIVMSAVKYDGAALEYASEDKKNNKQIVLAAVHNDGDNLKFASSLLQNDKQVVLKALSNSWSAILWASNNVRNDQEALAVAQQQNIDSVQVAHVLNNVQYMPQLIKGLPQYLKSHFELADALVKKNGLSLQFLSESLQDEFDIVINAVEQNGMALEFASAEKKDLYDTVEAAVEQNGLALQFASQESKNEEDLVIDAVTENGLALQFASENMKSNRQVVLAAITQNKQALKFASQELQQTLFES